MGWSVCSQPGCPTLHQGKGRCPEHARQADQARGSRHERGYGTEHRRLGDQAIQGATHCATCNEPFTTDNPVTRGHVKDIRAGGTPSDGYIAECRRCNYGWRRAGIEHPSTDHGA